MFLNEKIVRANLMAIVLVIVMAWVDVKYNLQIARVGAVVIVLWLATTAIWKRVNTKGGGVFNEKGEKE